MTTQTPAAKRIRIQTLYAHNDAWNKCDVCGRFFSFADIESGKATHVMDTPDSDWSSESWTSLCPKHYSER